MYALQTALKLAQQVIAEFDLCAVRIDMMPQTQLQPQQLWQNRHPICTLDPHVRPPTAIIKKQRKPGEKGCYLQGLKQSLEEFDMQQVQPLKGC